MLLNGRILNHTRLHAAYSDAPRPSPRCPSDGPLAASMNMSANSGPAMAIRTRMQIDEKTDRSGSTVALIG